MDSDPISAHVKTELGARGWTLHLRQRRARLYAYAARRVGTRIEERYLASLRDLPALLARVAALPNTGADVGQHPEKRDQAHQAKATEPGRLRLQHELLELGRLMNYRRFIVAPVFIDPGLAAWTRYAMTTDTPTLGKAIHAARVYYGHLRDAGLVQEPDAPSPPACTTIYDGAIMDQHTPNTTEPGSYDPLGNYWCAECATHCEVMQSGARLGWPEVYYFPDNPPGMQALMVNAGAEAWRDYLRIRGRMAVCTRRHCSCLKRGSGNNPRQRQEQLNRR